MISAVKIYDELIGIDFRRDLDTKVQFVLIGTMIQLFFWYFLHNSQQIRSLKKVSYKQQNNLINRIISSINGSSITIMCFSYCFFDQPSYQGKVENIDCFILLFMLTYYIYDTIASLYYNCEGLPLYIHHIIVIIGIFLTIQFDQASVYILYGIFLADTTVNFMNIRICLQIFDMRYTLAYEINEIALIVIYTIMRGVFMTKLCLDVQLDDNLNYLIKWSNLSMQLYSYYVINQMLNLFRKRKMEIQERKQKDISFYFFTKHPRSNELSYYKLIKNE